MDVKERVDRSIAEGKKCDLRWWVILCDPTELKQPSPIGQLLILATLTLTGILMVAGAVILIEHINNLWLFLALVSFGVLLVVFPMEDAQWDARWARPKGKAKEIWDYCVKQRLNPKMEKMWVNGYLKYPDGALIRYDDAAICIKIRW